MTKREIIDRLEIMAHWINNSKGYPESFKKSLERESERSLLEDLEFAKKHFLDNDPWATEEEMESNLEIWIKESILKSRLND
jgi:hypothetical protein